jgi:DNA-dependent RNA polymerase
MNMYIECLQNWVAGLKHESRDSLTILGFSKLGSKMINGENKIVSLYYSGVFMDFYEWSTNKYDESILRSRLAHVNLGKVVVLRVFNLSDDPFNDKILHFIKRSREIYDKEPWAFIFKDEGNKSHFMEKWLTDTEFFSGDLIDNLSRVLKEDDFSLIIIFNNTPLSLIKLKFWCKGYSISGGNNTLKGLLSPHNILVYNYLRWWWGDEKAHKLVDTSFKDYTKNRALSRKLFNLWDNKEKKICELLLKDIANFYDKDVLDEDAVTIHIEKIFNQMSNHDRRPNTSIKDLSINKITSLYSGGFVGDKNRAHNIRQVKNCSKFNWKNYHTAAYLSCKSGLGYLATIRNSVGRGSFAAPVIKKSFSYTSTSESKIHVDNNTKITQSKSELSFFIFQRLKYILDNKPFNRDTQEEIERYIFSQVTNFLNEKDDLLILGVNNSILSIELKKFCMDKSLDLNHSLNKLNRMFKSKKSVNKDLHKLKSSKTIMDFYLKSIFNTVSNNCLIDSMLYIFLLVITYNNVNRKNGDSITSVTNNGVKLGRLITDKYISELYKQYCKSNHNSTITYTKFREDILFVDLSSKSSLGVKYYRSILFSDEFYLKIGTTLFEIMEACSLLHIKVIKTAKNESLAILKVSDEISSKLDTKNPILVTPLNLPMIVKPKPYSNSEYGGYLLNDVEYNNSLILDKIGYDLPSKVVNNNIIYEVANNMMSSSFKVNKALLTYLLEENSVHKLLIDEQYVHEYENLESRTKTQEETYQEFLSKKIHERYIIEIAKTYADVPSIFFPIKLDNRGRLYTLPVYFSYQGSELAKALILFDCPDIIQRGDTAAIDFLKAYGATCYGNGLNRKSYDERLTWVNNNWGKIIDFRRNDLVSKADNKFLFLSFCFEIIRFNYFLNNESLTEFKTYLPIQLDGTCNGFQHLALLSNETRLFENLNLSKANKSDDPKDFYESVINQLNIYLDNKVNSINDIVSSSKDKNIITKYNKTLESCRRLIKINLKRSNIKTALMTIPYNASHSTLVDYVLKTFEYSHGERVTIVNKECDLVDRYLGWYKTINYKGEIHLFNYDDIDLLVKYMNEIIYVNYTKIKLLTKYLVDICQVLNNLNLPVIWRLPTGLEISQKYMKKYTKNIKPFKNLKTALSLTITDNIKIDTRKQKTALMPNLIHSLDASALFLLYNSFYKTVFKETHNVNFYSVHDCYGVTAKYVDTLISILKTIYIELYSDSLYLQKFDEDIIKMILSSYGEDSSSYNKKTRIIKIVKDGNKEDITLPEISNIIECKDKPLWYSNLSRSQFLIK